MAARFAHARAQEIVAPAGFASAQRCQPAILSNVSKSQSFSPRVTLQKFCRDNLAEELHSGKFYWKLSRSRRHCRPSGTARALRVFCVVWPALSIEVRKGEERSPGLYFSVRQWWTLRQRLPSGALLRQSAAITWPRFFTAARISSLDSVSSPQFFWPGSRLQDCLGSLAHPIPRIRMFSASSPCSLATNTMSATMVLTVDTVTPV